MVLNQIFSKATIAVRLSSTEKDELFEEMVELLRAAHPDLNREEALNALRAREAKQSTGVMHAVAIPHGRCASLQANIGAIGISHAGIDYDALDGAPVHVVFMLLIAPKGTEQHVQALKQLSLVLQTQDFVQNLLQCTSSDDVYRLLCMTEESLITNL